MAVFQTLILNILPLYGLIVLGFVAGRYLDVNLHSIAKLLIFVLAPFVAFGAVLNIEFNPSYVLLPILMWCVSITVTFTALKICNSIWHDGNGYLVAAGGVNGNAIYFGLSPILVLFGPAGLGVYLFMNLGPMINNFTLSYYLTARGKYSVRDSLMKVVRLPVLYAFVFGIPLNVLGYELPEIAERYWNYSAGSTVILGMMMIGIALSKLDSLRFDWKLISAFLVTKFIAWPAAIFMIILIDHNITGLFSSDIHQMMALFSAMPLIANLVAFAAENDLHPRRAAAAVLISTLVALITIPLAYLLVQLLIS